MNNNPFSFLIGGIFSLMIAMGIGRFAYTPILPLMQEALTFTDSVAGYLASSNYAGYFVGAILTGVLPLKKHKTFYLRVSLVASIITTCMMGLTQAYILMLIIRFISGVASAFIFVLASSIVLDKLASAGKTNWSGYFYSGVGFGIFFSTLFIPSFNDLYMWEGVWVGLAIVSSILTIFVWFWLKDSPNSNVKKDVQIVITQAPPLKWLTWLIIAYGLEGLGYIVTGTFIVSIAEKTPIFSIDSAIVWMVVGLGAIPSCIIWSTLAKKWGYVKSLVFSMILQSIGIALPAFWLSQSSLLISALLFGATFMGITTLATTLARQMSPSNSSRIIGYLTAIYAAGQMIGPTIAGILLSYTQSFNLALIGAASVVFIGSMLLVSGIRFDRIPNLETSLLKSNEKREF
ncbi:MULTISPECIES: YbfB/YjiJ family MFS transporter [Bacillaceae]|uniref:Arabinose efflux permease family protein n=3 Tax=Bacillaceae TaxID=186817 RepID=A0A072NJ57_SCHAZ|nr:MULTISPECIES: YbfB/YjiJ family MFS transporter [Bacillaceae]KEF36938.1 arabinose efflux permease family protein [Schinkia azotoformans MEV2011]MEC1695985.1 YbfB/YjiJ family MFS transporter [Schinkia azotoformans]MEC1724494.1 YbfB/YjiJ family MFS transporter [Schinkia azotoformans]MEC1773398.1 YbfB/YjiJ family MFS transporter [Schinkia azotoformans]MED4366089.1 YbfB/YjiJ family MFS transporter [Schinkia azotoformans]